MYCRPHPSTDRVDQSQTPSSRPAASMRTMAISTIRSAPRRRIRGFQIHDRSPRLRVCGARTAPDKPTSPPICLMWSVGGGYDKSTCFALGSGRAQAVSPTTVSTADGQPLSPDGVVGLRPRD